ncbi:hypothetical protein JZ785_13045 [Alicyclobacillus curvatus]|jgi:uncharacterized paraquat-inducible protein A|nr:hypothetical protein JZ785_13045 [Alicyclobacillus curvatus]
MGNFGNRRKPLAEQVFADKMIWQCTTCNCWSREEFVYVDEPTCPMCHGKMVHEQKHIRIE